MKTTEALIKEYKSLSKGMIDAQKYAYYAATHHSTAIEGSTLTESQVINLLEFGKSAANKPFEENLMVFDHHQAILFVLAQAKNKTEITPQFLRQIAALVCKNTGGIVNTILGNYDIAKGDFRLGSVRAGNRFFPDAKKVPKLIDNFCIITNVEIIRAKSIEAKLRLAFSVHFQLVSIHPFGDGNGRTSRLLMNFVQAYFNLPLGIVYKSDRIKYINALEAARNAENEDVFIDFMFRQYHKFLKDEIKNLQK